MEAGTRHVAGNALIDLVKYAKYYEKQEGPLPLGAETRTFVSGRVVTTQWYSLSFFHDILAGLDAKIWRGSEARARSSGPGAESRCAACRRPTGKRGL